jgi:hypothetical protein
MGLAERRAMLEFQQTVFPGLKKQIDDAAGFEVPLEINWDSLAEPDKAYLYSQYWTDIYFDPLIAALKSLCADDLGKGAVKESLKKVEILSTGQYYDGAGFSFEAGVLRLDDRNVNNQQVKKRTDKIISKIEKAL